MPREISRGNAEAESPKTEFLPMLELDGDVEGLQSRCSAFCKVSKVPLDVLFDFVRR